MQHRQRDADQKEKPTKNRKSVFESVFNESYVPFEELFNQSYLGTHSVAISSENNPKHQAQPEENE